MIVGSGVDWCYKQLIYSNSTQALIDFQLDNQIGVEAFRRHRQLWGNGNDELRQVIHA